MKNFILFACFMIGVQVFSQTEELKSYEVKKENLNKKITFLKDSLDKIELEISRIKSEKILNEINQKPILGIAKIKGKLKDKPDVNGEIILELNEETPVQIIDLIGDYFKICINEKCGYMSEIWLKRNSNLKEFVAIIEEREKYQEEKEKEEKIKEAKIEKERNAVADKALDQKMLKKYGKRNFDKMKGGYFWVGMNKEMLTFSIGEPDDINKTVGSWGTHEQWVYGNGLYIYLENGKVTSYQN